MEVQAIEKIEKMVKDGLTIKIDGQEYSAANLKPVIYHPAPETLVVHNLRGFAGFVNNDIDGIIKNGPHLIVVNSPESVDLISSAEGADMKRTVLVSAQIDKELEEFPFGRWMSQEEFSIMFRSLFAQKEGDDSGYVLSYASKLTGSTEVQVEDDGVTQKVQARRGVSGALKETVALKAIVKLSPYRTFREVEQSESEFLFRVRMNSDNVPVVALFEADGGAWVNQATANIVAYIQSMVETIPVIA